MADYPPRRVPLDTQVGYTTRAGEQRTLHSRMLEGDDDYAYIQPTTAEDVEILDAFGYDVARKAEGIARPRSRRPTSTRDNPPPFSTPDPTPEPVTRADAGMTRTATVVDETTGEPDTRGPGAPAFESGIVED